VKVCRSVGAGVVLSLLAAACGSSSAGGGSGKDVASGGGGDKELLVGILAPLTGELGSYGQDHVTAYKMALKEIQDSGALPAGTTVKMLVEDEGGSAEIAVRAAKKYVEVDKVDVIIGPTSLAMIALDPIAKQNHVPVISSSAGTVRLDTLGGDWLYRTYPSDDAEGAAMAKYQLEQGVKKMSILVQNQESAQGIVKVLKANFERGGGKVVKQVEFNGGQPTYDAQVNQALQGNPDLVYLAAGEESARTAIREIRQAGYKGRFAVNGDLSSPGFLKAVGPGLMEGVCSGQAASDSTSEPATRFAAAYKAAAKEDTYVTVANSYDAFMLAVLAALKGKDMSGQSIHDNLRDVAGPPGDAAATFKDAATALTAGHDIDYTGASGPLDFDKTGTSAAGFSVFCVKAGAWAQNATYTPDQLAE
jgi:branched-chain amino acid transport system substrate-binding protein